MSEGQGVFVPVVGPSGSGKDSIMTYARQRLAAVPSVHFARRVITRPCDPGSEAHDTLDEAAFLAAEAAGEFSLSWRSHGLCYGIPREVEGRIAEGQIVVANLSRAHIGEAASRFTRTMPVLVKVSPQILAARLAARGRETETEIAARLTRSIDCTDLDNRCHVIRNDGTIETAGEAFLAFLQSIRMPN